MWCEEVEYVDYEESGWMWGKFKPLKSPSTKCYIALQCVLIISIYGYQK
jgi:hypothetical protein